MNQKKALFTIKEASVYTCFAEQTLYDWIYKRRIEYVKISRRVFIKKETLDNLISSGTIKAREASYV